MSNDTSDEYLEDIARLVAQLKIFPPSSWQKYEILELKHVYDILDTVLIQLILHSK